MDIENTKLVLKWIKEGRVKLKIRGTSLPSPFALGIIIQGQSDMIRIEDKQKFLKRMHEMHLKKFKIKNKV
jgi:Lhr-like helicase